MSNKTSDKNVGSIEKDIERCKQLTKPEHANWIGISNQLAIAHILAEREQDKERIKELEEERDHWHGCFIVAMENSIAKEKVIDVIQECKDKVEQYNEYKEQGKETEVEYYENIANTIVVQVLQELLEGEK